MHDVSYQIKKKTFLGNKIVVATINLGNDKAPDLQWSSLRNFRMFLKLISYIYTMISIEMEG